MNMNFDNWSRAGQSMHMQRKPCDIIIIQDYLLMISSKVLSLIQSWAHAFSPDPDLRGVAEVSLAHCLGSLYSTAKILIVDGQVYMDLKRKGVEFPTPSDEDLLLVQSRQPATVCFQLYKQYQHNSTISSIIAMINMHHAYQLATVCALLITWASILNTMATAIITISIITIIIIITKLITG